MLLIQPVTKSCPIVNAFDTGLYQKSSNSSHDGGEEPVGGVGRAHAPRRGADCARTAWARWFQLSVARSSAPGYRAWAGHQHTTWLRRASAQSQVQELAENKQYSIIRRCVLVRFRRGLPLFRQRRSCLGQSSCTLRNYGCLPEHVPMFLLRKGVWVRQL
jgi:hypothetical protein